MSAPQLFLGGRVTLHPGDCRDALAHISDCSVDSVASDPPYALVSIVKRFGGPNAAATKDGDVYARSSAGFMGKAWDTGEVAFSATFWAEILRVLKPGGHVVAMAGTRTYHRLACAIEDAGFEIRDQLAWCYGTGFPKSHNAGGGWGTALKPAWEPIVLARKPLVGTVAENVLRFGTGAINVDGCRVPSSEADQEAMRRVAGFNVSYSNGEAGNALSGSADGSLHRRDRTEFDATKGRWPANIVHDGSDEVLAAFPDSAGQLRPVTGDERANRTLHAYGDFGRSDSSMEPRGDSGSAARFFYSAKADADDRLGSKHPTVKPVDLMQWLCRLITPPGGIVLDPFAGTGTTGEAAFREGFSAVLIEREADYQADIARRMALCLAGPATRRAASAKARGRAEAAAPLFDLGEAS